MDRSQVQRESAGKQKRESVVQSSFACELIFRYIFFIFHRVEVKKIYPSFASHVHSWTTNPVYKTKTLQNKKTTKHMTLFVWLKM